MAEPPATDAEIVAYLNQHGPLYSRDSLRQQLLASGVSLEQIDAAFAAWEATLPPAPRIWPQALLVFGINFAIPLLLVALAINSSGSPTWGVALLSGPVLVLVELIAGLGLRQSEPRLGKALVAGAVSTGAAAVVLSLLALGICLSY